MKIPLRQSFDRCSETDHVSGYDGGFRKVSFGRNNLGVSLGISLFRQGMKLIGGPMRKREHGAIFAAQLPGTR
jgi:hypothetical protein